MDQLPRLGKRELICLLLFTCDYVVFVWRGSLLLWVLGMGYVILLWHSLSLPYIYFIWVKKNTTALEWSVIKYWGLKSVSGRQPAYRSSAASHYQYRIAGGLLFWTKQLEIRPEQQTTQAVITLL